MFITDVNWQYFFFSDFVRFLCQGIVSWKGNFINKFV